MKTYLTIIFIAIVFGLTWLHLLGYLGIYIGGVALGGLYKFYDNHITFKK